MEKSGWRKGKVQLRSAEGLPLLERERWHLDWDPEERSQLYEEELWDSLGSGHSICKGLKVGTKLKMSAW